MYLWSGDGKDSEKSEIDEYDALAIDDSIDLSIE